MEWQQFQNDLKSSQNSLFANAHTELTIKHYFINETQFSQWNDIQDMYKMRQ